METFDTTLRYSKPLRRGIGLAVALLAMAAALPGARAAEPLPPELEDVGVDDSRLGAQIPLSFQFQNEKGETVTLDQLISGERPVILTPVYYKCPMLCNLTLNGLVTAFNEMEYSVGEEFEVITYSINPRETAQLAAAKKQFYISDYGKPEAAQGWHWLASDEANARGLSGAIGFKYNAVEGMSDYAHPSVLMVLTPTGKLSRFIEGPNFKGRDLKLALLEASNGKIGSALDHILLTCYHYDPTSNSYVPVAWKIMRLGGIVTVLLIGGLIGGLLLLDRRRSRGATGGDGHDGPRHLPPTHAHPHPHA